MMLGYEMSGSREPATLTSMSRAWVRPLRIMRERPIMNRSRGKCSRGMLLMAALSAKGLTSASGIALRTQTAHNTDGLPTVEEEARQAAEIWLSCLKEESSTEGAAAPVAGAAECSVGLCVIMPQCCSTAASMSLGQLKKRAVAAPGVEDDAGDCGDCESISRAPRRRPELQSHALHGALQY